MHIWLISCTLHCSSCSLDDSVCVSASAALCDATGGDMRWLRASRFKLLALDFVFASDLC